MKTLLDLDAKCALIRNDLGNTPLHIAADEGSLAAAIALCSKAPKSAEIQVCLFWCLDCNPSYSPL